MIKKLLIISMIIVAKSSFGQYIYQLRAVPVYTMDGDVIYQVMHTDCFPNLADSMKFFNDYKKPIYEIYKINIKTKKYTIITKSEKPIKKGTAVQNQIIESDTLLYPHKLD